MDTPQPNATQPVFNVLRLYLKDLSFENPNAPDGLLQAKGEPKLDFNLNTVANHKGNDLFEVVMHIDINSTQDGKTMFLLEMDYAGLFQLRNFPADNMKMLLGIECPHIIYPYVRQVVSQTIADGGFKPFILEPINFAALYQRTQQQMAAANGGQE